MNCYVLLETLKICLNGFFSGVIKGNQDNIRRFVRTVQSNLQFSKPKRICRKRFIWWLASMKFSFQCLASSFIVSLNFLCHLLDMDIKGVITIIKDYYHGRRLHFCMEIYASFSIQPFRHVKRIYKSLTALKSILNSLTNATITAILMFSTTYLHKPYTYVEGNIINEIRLKGNPTNKMESIKKACLSQCQDALRRTIEIFVVLLEILGKTMNSPKMYSMCTLLWCKYIILFFKSLKATRRQQQSFIARTIFCFVLIASKCVVWHWWS